MERKRRMRSSILSAMSSHQLTEYEKMNIPNSFDLVISAGGFYGFYVIGVDKIMKKLERNRFIQIRRYAGSSVGAFCSILMCCDVSTRHLVDLYERLYNRKDYFMILREEVLRLLPEDAYKRCSGRVFIHALEISWSGIRPAVFSEYSSNIDLVDACMASSNCPVLISPYIFYRYKNGYYLDGCFSTALPVFPDGMPQLLIKLYHLDYSIWTSVYPSDSSIEGLIVKGAIEAEKFFQNQHQSRVFQWYHDHRRQRRHLYIVIGCGCSITFLALWWRRSQ